MSGGGGEGEMREGEAGEESPPGYLTRCFRHDVLFKSPSVFLEAGEGRGPQRG